MYKLTFFAPLALLALTACTSPVSGPAGLTTRAEADREFETHLAAGRLDTAAAQLAHLRQLATPEDRQAIDDKAARLRAAREEQARPRLLRAREWIALGDAENAYAEANAVAGILPEADSLCRRLRQVMTGNDDVELRPLEAKGDLAAALRGWQNLAEKNPGDPAAACGIRRVNTWMTKAQAEYETGKLCQSRGRDTEAIGHYGAALAIWPMSPAAGEIAALREALAQKTATNLTGGLRAYWQCRAQNDFQGARDALMGVLATGTPVAEVAPLFSATYEVQSRRHLATGEPAAALFTAEYGIAELAGLLPGSEKALTALTRTATEHLRQAGQGIVESSNGPAGAWAEAESKKGPERIEAISACAVRLNKPGRLNEQRREWRNQSRP